jgi:SprT-like family
VSWAQHVHLYVCVELNGDSVKNAKVVYEGIEVTGDELGPVADEPVDERAPARAHRQLAAAEPTEFPAPAILYERFDVWNARFFGARLQQALIMITNCALRAHADYCPADVNGIRSRIRIAPHLWAKGGGLLLLDTLLHEMVHAWCHEVEGDIELGYRGHGPKFAAKCNEIGAILGLAEVSPKGRNGKPDCAHWPIRPDGYYGPDWPPRKRRRQSSPTVEPTGRTGESLNNRLLRVLADITGLSCSRYLRELLLEQARQHRDECIARDPELADLLG